MCEQVLFFVGDRRANKSIFRLNFFSLVCFLAQTFLMIVLFAMFEASFFMPPKLMLTV